MLRVWEVKKTTRIWEVDGLVGTKPGRRLHCSGSQMKRREETIVKGDWARAPGIWGSSSSSSAFTRVFWERRSLETWELWRERKELFLCFCFLSWGNYQHIICWLYSLGRRKWLSHTPGSRGLAHWPRKVVDSMSFASIFRVIDAYKMYWVTQRYQLGTLEREDPTNCKQSD